MKKVLVIDDDQFFAKNLENYLTRDKYTVISAEDGEVGLKKLVEEKPDIIILDLMMPTLDGESFLRKLKEDPNLPKAPVLVSSNLSSVKKVSDVMSLGAVGYVVKSDESMQSIVQDVERILKGKEQI